MKIMFFTPYNVAGGAERVISSLANEFSHSHDVILVTFDTKSNFYPVNSDIKVIRMGLHTDGMSNRKKALHIIPIEYKRFRKFSHILHEETPDIVISFLFMTNVISSVCCRKTGIPVILSERNDPARYSKLKKMVMKVLYSKVNGMVCQSSYMEEYARQTYNLDHVVTIPNPLSCNQYSSVPVNKSPQIISVGRLIPQKNHAMLIRAFARVSTEFPEYQLTIYGEGTLKSDLMALTEELGLNGKVFFPGVVSEVLKLNSNALMFILSSDFEGYPNVLAEAMANGIISVSTDFPTRSARDIISDRQNGFLINVGDTDALVQIMKEVFSHPEKFRYIEENARKIVNQIGIDVISEKWLVFIRQIVEEFDK